VLQPGGDLDLPEEPVAADGDGKLRPEALGGLNRYRFVNDPDLLAQWDSASNVVAGRRASGEMLNFRPLELRSGGWRLESGGNG
jgi:hypothetical protein